jgi:signal transduction histidine kinase
MKTIICFIILICFSSFCHAENIAWELCSSARCIPENGNDIFKAFNTHQNLNFFYKSKIKNIECNPDNCWAFLGRVDDSVEVLINGEKVFSTLDEHQKHFHTGYDQLVFKIPQHLVTKNELDFRIEIHDLNEYKYSVDTKQFFISNYKAVRFKQMSKWVGVTGVILFSAFFQVLFVLLSLFFGVYFKERKAFFLTIYAFFATLYLFSLSEIPRALINPVFASGPLHFSLRLLYDLSFLVLIKAYFDKIKISPVVYLIYITIPVLMFFSWVVGFRSFSHYQSIMFFSAVLVLLPPLYGIFSINKHEFLEKKQKITSFVFFFLIFLLTTNDLLFFWQILRTSFMVGYFTPLVTLYFVIYSILHYQKILMEQESKKNIFDIALQVSHDIRSPLAALKMAISQLGNISEDSRIILRGAVVRINDIANNLYLENKTQNLNQTVSKSNLSKKSLELIGPIVDYLVSEKKLVLKNQYAITLEAELNHSYGLFCEINSSEFKRVLSNLINNSIEAYSDDGKIIIKVESATLDNQNYIVVTIQDYGKGIPQEIISKVGIKGFTYGKTNNDSGSGLGMSHAFSVIRSYGGKIDIDSNLGFGTTVKIHLPKKEAPSWFVKTIIIKEGTNVLILDDDENIHQLWRERFKVFNNIVIKSFMNVDAFKKAVEAEVRDNDNQLFLIDYNLSQQGLNGIDVIQDLGISEKSILVTNYFEEPEVLAKISSRNLNLIPKTMAEFVPIQFNLREDKIYLDMLYVEDDELLALSWESAAKKKKLKFKRIKCCEDFDLVKHVIDKEKTEIYLDNEFGMNKMKGEDFSLFLHNQGYQKIFISSGHETEYFKSYSWLKIVGKSFPLI